MCWCRYPFSKVEGPEGTEEEIYTPTRYPSLPCSPGESREVETRQPNVSPGVGHWVQDLRSIRPPLRWTTSLPWSGLLGDPSRRPQSGYR